MDSAGYGGLAGLEQEGWVDAGPNVDSFRVCSSTNQSVRVRCLYVYQRSLGHNALNQRENGASGKSETKLMPARAPAPHSLMTKIGVVGWWGGV